MFKLLTCFVSLLFVVVILISIYILPQVYNPNHYAKEILLNLIRVCIGEIRPLGVSTRITHYFKNVVVIKQLRSSNSTYKLRRSSNDGAIGLWALFPQIMFNNQQVLFFSQPILWTCYNSVRSRLIMEFQDKVKSASFVWVL